MPVASSGRAANAAKRAPSEDPRRNLTEATAGTAPLARPSQRLHGREPARPGVGFAAWEASGATYILTADHVVADAVAAGEPLVTVRRGGREWQAEVLRTDAVNDLAVVRAPAGSPSRSGSGLARGPAEAGR